MSASRSTWRSRIGAALAVLLITLALLLTAVRALVTYAPSFRAEVEARLSATLGQPLELGGLRAHWYGRHPRLVLEEVRLLDDQGSPALHLDELELGIGIFRSLQARNLMPVDVAVAGLALTVERGEDGALALRGLEALPLGESRDDKLPQLPYRVRLRDARLTYVDRPRGERIRLGPSQLVLETEQDRYRLAGALSPSDELAEQLRFRLEWSGQPAQASGRMFVDVRGLALGAVRHWLPADLELPAIDGGFSGQLWARVESGRLDEITGDVNLQALRLPGGASGPGAARTRFDWRRQEGGWQLALDRLQLALGGAPWPSGRLTLDYRAAPEDARELRLGGDYAQLRDVWRVLEQIPLLSEDLRRYLMAFEPRGELRDYAAYLRWRPGAGVEDYRAHALLDSLETAPVDGIPGVENVSGEFIAHRAGGTLRLRGRDGGVHLPRLFRQTLPFDRLNANLHWWVEPGEAWQALVPELRLSGPHGSARARVRVAKADAGAPFIDIRAHVEDADARYTPHYLPTGIMHPNLVGWLEQAIQGGRIPSADVIVFGRSSEFPFAQAQGVFDVRARVLEGRLNYLPDWPALEGLDARLHFSGRRMQISADDGGVYGARLRSARAVIDDLSRAELRLEGRLRGSGADMLRFLAESPLGRPIEQPLDLFRLGGTHELDLDVEVPLRPHGAPRVSGRLDLGGGTLAMPSLGLEIERVRGEVEFTEQGVSAERLSGHFRGSDVIARADTHGEGASARIDLRADFTGNPARLLELPALAPLLGGESRWRFDLRLPGFQTGAGPGVDLALTSTLEGVEVDLPPPFAKIAEEGRPLRLDLHIDGEGVSPVRLRLGEAVRAALRFGEKGISHAALRFRDGEAQLPQHPGLTIQGELPELDLDAWRRRLHTVVGAASDAPDQDPEGAELPALSLVDMRARRLRVLEQAFEDVELGVSAAVLGWHLRVRGPAVEGTLLVPRNARRGTLTADFERLYLEGAEQLAGQARAPVEPVAAIDPRSLPPLALSVNDLRLDGAELGTLQLRSRRREDGLALEELTLRGPVLALESSGNWRWANGQPRTELALRSQSRDTGAALALFGYSRIVRGGAGSSELALAWPGAPHQFSLARVDGEAALNVRDGHLPEVEPGAGRVFGLLSVAMLPRRLAFDFSDLFGRGFAFDQIGTRMRLREGEAELDYFYIQGPAARVDATGSIDLVERSFDQRVVVTPRVSAALPLVGGLAAGPMGVVALFVTQKLLESEIDKLSRYRYRVTGGWENPRIERVGSSAPAEGGVPAPAN